MNFAWGRGGGDFENKAHPGFGVRAELGNAHNQGWAICRVRYQSQGAGIGIVFLVPKFYKAAIRNQEITKNMYFQEQKTI